MTLVYFVLIWYVYKAQRNIRDIRRRFSWRIKMSILRLYMCVSFSIILSNVIYIFFLVQILSKFSWSQASETREKFRWPNSLRFNVCFYLWTAFTENAMQIPEACLCSIPSKSLKLRAALQTVPIDREHVWFSIYKTQDKAHWINKKNYEEKIFENKMEFHKYKNRLILHSLLYQWDNVMRV